jgi:hypothetical protein
MVAGRFSPLRGCGEWQGVRAATILNAHNSNARAASGDLDTRAEPARLRRAAAFANVLGGAVAALAASSFLHLRFATAVTGIVLGRVVRDDLADSPRRMLGEEM